MKSRRPAATLTLKMIILAALTILLVMGGCKNDLVNSIQEEVQVAVTPPTISNIYPTANAVNVAISINEITIDFTKSIASSSVTSSTINIRNAEGNLVSGRFTITGPTVSFSPSGSLRYSDTYSVTITSGVKDLDGNPLVEDFTWTFTTEAAPAGIRPVIEVFNLQNGKKATNSGTVPLNIFAKDHNNTTTGLQFRYREGNSPTWSSWIDLTDGAGSAAVELAVTPGTAETFTYQAEVRDPLGIPSYLASAQIIYERDPPSLIDVNWDDAAIFPYNGSILRVTFNEEMAPDSLTYSDFILETLAGTSWVDVEGFLSFAASSTNPNAVVELWGLSLQPNAEYKVTLQPTITDVAGNEMGGNQQIWYFNTGDAADTTPPDGTVLLVDPDPDPEDVQTVVILPTGSIATKNAVVQLDLSGITDDYNTVWGMKFWGDSNGTEAAFEENASWEPFSSTRNWTLSGAAGSKFVLYKFVDSAGNESASPGQLKLILDNEIPDTPVIIINDDDALTNAADNKVRLSLAAYDGHSGVKEMMISHSSLFTGATWQPWKPSVENWELTSSEGTKTVYLKVRDHLDQESPVDSDAVILDKSPPVISFNSTQFMINTETRILEGSAGTDLYEITEINGIDSYLWKTLSGPGNVVFNTASGAGSADNGTTVREPYMIADTEGTYFIQLTLVDNAGNIGSASIPITWDETPPGPIQNLSVTQSNPGYSTSTQPSWSWNVVPDADFYRLSNTSDFSVFIDTSLNNYTPNLPLSQGLRTLYVKAMDLAGNESAVSSAGVFIDSIPPSVTVTTYNYIANQNEPSATIDFSGGLVTDGGSGLAAYQWTKIQGPGTLSFTSPQNTITDVSANADGEYSIGFTATDLAGNSRTVQLTLLRDIQPPAAPTVTGLTLTPSVRPTWFWTSGEDNIGVYEYDLDDTGVWTELEAASYTPDFDLTGTPPGVNHTLEVRVRDAAGNWSPVGSWTIEVDTSAKTPPGITLADGLPSLRTSKDVTWQAVSGLGGSGAGYRYKIDNLGWIEIGSPLSDNPSAPTVIPQFTGLSEGNHTLSIQEKLLDWEIEKTGTHMITVDTIEPNSPSLSGTGLNTIDTDRTATSDTTPTWSWSSGGGGNGLYRYEFNNSGSWITTSSKSYTHASTLANDTYVFKVQERDAAGNWSALSSHRITVDTVPPVISTLLLSGLTHPLDSADTYTRTTNVSVTITGDVSSEGGRPVEVRYYDYNPSGWKTWGSYFIGSTKTITTALSSVNGTKIVYVQLVDEAGNSSGSLSDTIILDTAPPAGTFSINEGAATTPSLLFNMNLTASDNISSAADIEVKLYNSNNATWGAYRPYSAVMTSDFEFSKSAGTKYSYVAFRDAAGNETSAIYDSIVLQAPVMTSATKGSSSTSITVTWNPVSSTAGTTYYYLYSTTNANANPNSDPGSVTAESLVTSGSSITENLNSSEKEQLRYYFVRTYNAATGGWGLFSPAPVLGFGSHITIVYDSTDPTDTTLANYIKTILQSNLPSTSPSSVSGSMPSWSVTLLPENLVSATYSSNNIISGDPIILTTSAQDLSANTNKTRNLVASGRGIIAMGFNALKFFETVSNNWISWGYPATASTDADQQPVDIKYGNSYRYSADKYYMYTWRSGNSVWTSPLTSNSIPTSSNEDQVQIGYSAAAAAERALVRPGRDNPTRGYLYGRSQSYTDSFPVVRQGRFLFYGFDQMWTRPTSGWVYFINLVSRMSQY